MSKYIFLLLVMSVTLGFSGCQTVKGAATGFSQDVQSTPQYAQNGWDDIMRLDDWIQRNLW